MVRIMNDTRFLFFQHALVSFGVFPLSPGMLAEVLRKIYHR